MKLKTIEKTFNRYKRNRILFGILKHILYFPLVLPTLIIIPLFIVLYFTSFTVSYFADKTTHFSKYIIFTVLDWLNDKSFTTRGRFKFRKGKMRSRLNIYSIETGIKRIKKREELKLKKNKNITCGRKFPRLKSLFLDISAVISSVIHCKSK